MAIEKISASQFRTQIRNGITARTKTHDTAYGPIRDIVIDPMSTVLERQNDRIRRVSLLVSLINTGTFTDEELDALVFNEGLTRILGSFATGTIVFSTLVVDTTGPDIIVPRGFPVATQAGAGGSDTITYVTTETSTLVVAQAASYKNFEVDPPQFELEVPVIATVQGSIGNVGATRVNRPLRPLVGFDSVSNPESISGGRDAETNDELIQRYLLAILGRDIATPTGIERYARDNFPDLADIKPIYGNNPLMLRDAEDSGAVDAYLIGDQLTTRTESLTFLGIGQLIELTYPPLRQVSSVENITSAATYTEGVDYEVVFDTSNESGSTRASEGIRFLADDLAAPTPPAAGDVIRIEYTSNNLVRRIQATFEQDDVRVFGRDLLFREGTRVDIILEASLRVASGFSTVTIPSAVEAAVLDYINTLNLGDDLEESDLQAVVRAVSGVDNFIITRLVRDASASGAADITIADNEYARITQGPDFQVTLI